MNMEWLAGVIDCGSVPVNTEMLNTRLGAMDKNTSFLLRADKGVALQRFIGFADVQAARLFEGGPTGGGKQAKTATATGTRAMAGGK